MQTHKYFKQTGLKYKRFVIIQFWKEGNHHTCPYCGFIITSCRSCIATTLAVAVAVAVAAATKAAVLNADVPPWKSPFAVGPDGGMLLGIPADNADDWAVYLWNWSDGDEDCCFLLRLSLID